MGAIHMKTIYLELANDCIQFEGSYKDDWGMNRKFESFKVKSFSGQMVHITVIKDSMKLTTITKKMNFDNGSVFISFGKNKIKVGEYE
jgi:hypothetical protein